MRYIDVVLLIDDDCLIKKLNLKPRVECWTGDGLEECDVSNQISEGKLLVLNYVSRYFFRNANRFEKWLKNSSENVVIFNFSADNKSNWNVELVLFLDFTRSVVFVFGWSIMRLGSAIVRLLSGLVTNFSLLNFICSGSFVCLLIAAKSGGYVQSRKSRFLAVLGLNSRRGYEWRGSFSAGFSV